jgi:hypothetical protein
MWKAELERCTMARFFGGVKLVNVARQDAHSRFCQFKNNNLRTTKANVQIIGFGVA